MRDLLQQGFWTVCYYGFLLLFAVGIYAVNLVCIPLNLLLGPIRARATLRRIVYRLFRFYAWAMCGSGALRTNDSILRQLQAGPKGRIIIANHPSIVDAPIILSRVPGLLCVFKSSLKRSFTMGRTARTLGYLSNDEGISMLKDMAEALSNGDQVLFFPEGTRTSHGILNPLNAGYALAAMRAAVPVQLVCIRSESPILTKRQHFLKAGRFPVEFQFEIGPSIEPGTFNTVRQYNHFVEDWFRSNLSSTRPARRPFLPVGAEAVSEGDRHRLSFEVPEDPFYCRGHMQGHPLVPAFAQMTWVHEMISAVEADPPGGLQFFRWKFLQPLHPGDPVEITISGQSGRREVVINRKGERATQGRVLLLQGEAQA